MGWTGSFSERVGSLGALLYFLDPKAQAVAAGLCFQLVGISKRSPNAAPQGGSVVVAPLSWCLAPADPELGEALAALAPSQAHRLWDVFSSEPGPLSIESHLLASVEDFLSTAGSKWHSFLAFILLYSFTNYLLSPRTLGKERGDPCAPAHMCPNPIYKCGSGVNVAVRLWLMMAPYSHGYHLREGDVGLIFKGTAILIEHILSSNDLWAWMWGKDSTEHSEGGVI